MRNHFRGEGAIFALSFVDRIVLRPWLIRRASLSHQYAQYLRYFPIDVWGIGLYNDSIRKLPIR